MFLCLRTTGTFVVRRFRPERGRGCDWSHTLSFCGGTYCERVDSSSGKLEFQPELLHLRKGLSVKLPEPLRGVVTARITPLLDRDTLEIAGLKRLIDSLIDGEVNGLFILGTTGEGAGQTWGRWALSPPRGVGVMAVTSIYLFVYLP